MEPPSQFNPEPEFPNFGATCTIIGGPNGSGKSSIFAAIEPPGRFVNADVIARQINPSNPERVSIAAGRVVLRELEQIIASRQDFAYETTLSSHQSIELMKSALDANYEVGLVFVALRDAELNVDRVAQRVAAGGHDIPKHVIRRRYETSLGRLVDAIRLAHGTMIFDNSEITGPALILRIAMGMIQANNLDEAQVFHCRIALLVSEALGIGANEVFKAAKSDYS